MRCLVRALSAGYTVIAAFLPNLIGSTNSAAGILLRDSASGKIVRFCLVNASGNVQLQVAQYSSASAGVANEIASTYNLGTVGPLIWLKLQDDGTHRLFSISTDGVNWLQVQSTANTDYITPNQAGFFADTGNTSTLPGGITLLSWSGA